MVRISLTTFCSLVNKYGIHFGFFVNCNKFEGNDYPWL